MDVNKIELTTWDIEEVLQGFGITKNEVNGECAISAIDDKKCEGGCGYDIGEVISSDREQINLYYCKECGKLSYFINED